MSNIEFSEVKFEEMAKFMSTLFDQDLRLLNLVNELLTRIEILEAQIAALEVKPYLDD